MKKFKLTLLPTKSMTYIMPIFAREIGFKFLNRIVGSYLENNSQEKLYSVVYKFSSKPAYIDYEETLAKHPLYVGHEDYDDHVLYKFKTTDRIQATIELFKEGKYSGFSEKDKGDVYGILEMRGFTKMSQLKQIFNRDETLRKQMQKDLKCEIPVGSELSSPPVMASETFSDFASILNLVQENTKDLYE